jgi:hypothetical protein
MQNIPRPVRQSAVNLFVIFAAFAVGFGCLCADTERDSRGRQVSNSEEPAANSARSNKSRTKANTQANTARRSEEPDKGDFQVEYVDVQDSRYERLNQEMRSEKVLENAARDLNKALALPYDITLVTRDCGEINAYYREDERSITVCYEIMDYYYALFQKAGNYSEQEANQKMADALQFIFLHELGHALVDAYQLPVTGNEEDAADKLSSYVNLKELKDSGSRAAIAAAEAFDLQAKMSSGQDLKFYDEHSLDQQRFYNILCQLFGSNPNKYEVLVTDGALPEPRAVRCPSEYQKNIQTWDKLLEKYRKQ